MRLFTMKAFILLMGMTLSGSSLISQIIPPVGATSNYTLTTGQSTNFYDPAGPGGNSCGTGPVPQGNYSNCNCATIVTINAAIGEFLTCSFNEFSMWNTTSGWDWMTIHDGASIAAPILYDNRAGGPDNPFGDCGLGSNILDFCATGRSLTFRFWATSVVNRAGWDATVASNSNACTLPIELDYFTGEKLDHGNIISWATYTEINNDYFTLERSADAKKWEIINTQAGAGTSSEHNTYSFLDADVLIGGVSYYRLTQTDFDGKHESFQIISIVNTPHQTEKPKAYDTIGRVIVDPDHYIGVIIYKYSNGFWYKVTRLK